MAEDAVSRELAPLEFPANREKYREYRACAGGDSGVKHCEYVLWTRSMTPCTASGPKTIPAIAMQMMSNGASEKIV